MHMHTNIHTPIHTPSNVIHCTRTQAGKSSQLENNSLYQRLLNYYLPADALGFYSNP